MDKKKFLVNMIIGLVIAAVVFFLYWGDDRAILHRFCDGCFVAGVVLMGMGGLKVARTAGTFDIMSYGIAEAVHMTLPWLRTEKKDADFAAYKERKREERKPSGDLLAAGGIYLALAAIFLVLYLLFAS